MQNILVTGAGGYLGSVLVPELLKLGHTVTAADAFYFGDVLADHADHPGLRIQRGDIRHLKADALDGVDVVIALAAISNDPAGRLNPAWTRQINAEAAARLAELARTAGARRLIHASSCGVYGHSDEVIDESSPLAPLSEYTQSKVDAEQALSALQTSEFRVISLRLGTLFGVSPRMRFDLGVHAMTRAAVTSGRIRVDGDGQQWRPLLHVADAANAFVACLDIPDEQLPKAAVFNVVGANLRIRGLADIVAEGCDGVLVDVTGGTPDARTYRVTGHRFATLAGWSPARTVADGVAEVRAWLVDHRDEDPPSTAEAMSRMLCTPAVDGGDPVRREPLPFALPLFGLEEETELLDTLRSGWLSTGPRSKKFEQMIADYTGAKYCVATNSCTAALHSALIVAGIGPGDEVITSPITWPATGNVIVHAGATPVFADIDPDTLMITPETVEKVITPRTKAIMPVHMAGQPCDIAAIGELAARHRLLVIEDAAHALGAEQDGRRIGTWSPLTCFSFYATKNVACGEGGALVTDNQEMADKARMLVMHGISRDAWKRYSVGGSPHWQQFEAGFKYNMPDTAAALGIHQLPKLDRFIARRAWIADRYDELFADVAAIRPIRRLAGVRHAHHLYIIDLDLDALTISRDEFVAALKAEGINTGIHFIALTRQPYYQREHGMTAATTPAASAVSDRIVSLPLYPAMTDSDVGDVAAAVRKLATAYYR